MNDMTFIEFEDWFNGKPAYELVLDGIPATDSSTFVQGRFEGELNNAEHLFNWCVDNASCGWTMQSLFDKEDGGYCFWIMFESEADFARAKLIVHSLP